MTDQHRRYWANIETVLSQLNVFARDAAAEYTADPVLEYCWAGVGIKPAKNVEGIYFNLSPCFFR